MQSNHKMNNAVLSELVKLPTKDFEEKFREWMERDEVTRSLQAKLRRDLIANFNKTALGRHIMSQTTMTTSGAFGGGKTQRLTLSPVVLALNTLVAEFLYAENCHYTLSVFCTEVPFRNTLPDFDERTPFRFASTEVNELLAALVSSKAAEQQLNQQITAKYTASNTSLLFLVLEYLLANLETKEWPKNVEHRSTMTKAEQQSSTTSAAASKNDEMHELNEYMLMLSSKMKVMIQQFNAKPLWRTRGRAKKPKSLNRSLDQLKKLTQEKTYNKQMRAVLTAINKLGNQFENCANNFAHIYDDTKQKDESNTVEMANASNQRQVSTQTEEKSYSGWMHEIRNSRNGRKFLNRLEGRFMKALNTKKAELTAEINEELEQRKALLKIRYKQKLIDHISRQSTVPMDEVITEMQKQLTDLHKEYNQLLQKLQEKEQAQIHNKEYTEQPQAKSLVYEKEIDKLMQDLQLEDDTGVDNLVQDAK